MTPPRRIDAADVADAADVEVMACR